MATITLTAHDRTLCACTPAIARIKGRGVKSTFSYQIIGTVAIRGKEVATAVVDEPGLYQISDIDSNGLQEDTYIIVACKPDGELVDSVVSMDTAMSLAKAIESRPISDLIGYDYYRDCATWTCHPDGIAVRIASDNQPAALLATMKRGLSKLMATPEPSHWGEYWVNAKRFVRPEGGTVQQAIEAEIARLSQVVAELAQADADMAAASPKHAQIAQVRALMAELGVTMDDLWATTPDTVPATAAARGE